MNSKNKNVKFSRDGKVTVTFDSAIDAKVYLDASLKSIRAEMDKLRDENPTEIMPDLYFTLAKKYWALHDIHSTIYTKASVDKYLQRQRLTA